MSERTLMALGLFCCAMPALAAPAISRGGVLNNASYARDGALNRAIAQGSIFAVYGSGLGPATLVQVQSFPLTKELAGTSVRVTIFGTSIDAYPIYVSDGQIGVLLPSSTPVGSGTVTVTYQGETSMPGPITVVRRNIGVFTANQGGSGPAIVQNFVSDTNQPLNTLTAPARPGQTVILWATGLGPVANELAAPAPGDFDARITVYVGGIPARVRYSGRSGCCAGIDQIVFDVPINVQGCYVPVQIAGAGLLSTAENATIPVEHTVSNSVTMSVANDQGVCTDPTGLTGAELASIQGKGRARIGGFTFVRRPAGILEAVQDTASGQFSQFDFAALLRSRGIFGLPAFGSCLQYQVNSSDLDSPDPIRAPALDAGSNLTVTGPNGSRQIARDAGGGYSSLLGGARESGGSTAEYLSPGSYTLAGTGGADIAAFQAAFTVPASLSWTNRDPEALSHSFSPEFQWNVSGPVNYVVAASYGRNDLTAFYSVCTEDPARRAFTIPNYAYAALVMHTSGAPGVVWIAAGTVTRFTAPGLDFGLINALAGTSGVFIP